MKTHENKYLVFCFYCTYTASRFSTAVRRKMLLCSLASSLNLKTDNKNPISLNNSHFTFFLMRLIPKSPITAILVLTFIPGIP